MTVSVVNQSNDSITLQINIKFGRSMLETENLIQDELNQAGAISTESLLKTFDTDGSPITFGSIKMTSMGLVSKHYQTPYGEITVDRHVYQTSKGGATFCPLEKDARIIIASTPRFASQISYKIAEMPAIAVVNDLSKNHNRNIAQNVVQRVSDAVSAIIQIKEESWDYQIPNIEDKEIKTVSIGLDGTCMLMSEGAYRQAMVGTIALYDNKGERQHTVYVSASPEYGKDKFIKRLTREIERAKGFYPEATYIGVADGAHDNWGFLKTHTTKQTVDFYHVSEYLAKASTVMFKDEKQRKKWLDETCHELKHTPGAAITILKQLEEFKTKQSQIKTKKKDSQNDDSGQKSPKDALNAAITYFTNNTKECRMNYAEAKAANEPIGSGVTEAACKTIVKQRLCKSGMRWKDKGAAAILSLRALMKSDGRWEQFWGKVNQYGFPVAA